MIGLPPANIDRFEADRVMRELQREVADCSKRNRTLGLDYLVEEQAITLVARGERKILLKVDFPDRGGNFCKITDVPAMLRYMDRNGSVKAWDDHKEHTSVVRSPQRSFDELTKRMDSAVAAYAQNPGAIAWLGHR